MTSTSAVRPLSPAHQRGSLVILRTAVCASVPSLLEVLGLGFGDFVGISHSIGMQLRIQEMKHARARSRLWPRATGESSFGSLDWNTTDINSIV